MTVLPPAFRSTFVSDRLSDIEACLSAGDWLGAVTASNAAQRAAPHDGHVLHASGRLCELADQPQDALSYWVHALAVDPSVAVSWSAIGTLLGRGEPIHSPQLIALLAFAQAHRADPEWLLPAWHMALLYHALGFGEAAEAALHQCGEVLKAHGDHPKNLGVVNLHNRSYMHLTLGHWREGFACYEYRLQDVGHLLSARAQKRPPEGVPRWTHGEPPKRLAVFVEQGAGDMFMVLPYVLRLLDQGVYVVLEAFPSMVDVLSDRLIGHYVGDHLDVIEQDDSLPSAVDGYVWAMSLPGLMGFDDPKQTLERKWRRPELINRVAFCWQGSRMHKSDKVRSMPVEQLRRVAELCRELGYAPVAVNPGEPVPDFLEDMGLIESFEATASILDTCVAVVSVDTALVHLAGSMGIPTFACLAALPDWRWGLVGRGHTTWYESVHLVRQPIVGQWAPVIDSVCEQLRAQIETIPTQPTL